MIHSTSLARMDNTMEIIDTPVPMFRKIFTRKICEQDGMTLVEVMTVLVIIALLALFAAPELINWKPKMNLKSASDDLAANLQRARVHAIKNNVSVIFEFKAPGTCVAPDTCPDGKYKFYDNAATPVTVAEVYFNKIYDGEMHYEGVRLQSSKFEAGQGYDFRGMRLVIPVPPNDDEYAALESSRMTDAGDPIYEVWMTTGGGVKIEKKARP